MLIKKIHLSNFKNFNNLEVELGAMNVFVGANASGKSNFIQSVKFIKDIEKHGIDNAVSLQGGIEYLRNIKLKERKNITIRLEMSPPGGIVIDRFSDNHFLGIRIKKMDYYLELSIKGKNRYEIAKEEIKYNSIIEEAIEDEFHRDIEGNYYTAITAAKGKIKYITDVKKTGKTKVTLKSGKVVDIENERINPFGIPYEFFKSQYIRKQSLIEQFSFLLPRSIEDFKIYDFDLKISKKPASITSKIELEESGDNLAVVLRNILNDKDSKRKFSNLITDILPFVKAIDVEKSQDNSLFFKIKEEFNSNVAIPSSLLSDGTISVTSIVTALFFEYNRLAAFEEPEHGVHPALVAKMMQFFYDTSQERQIIITTHSPEIVKHTKISDLFLVSRNNEGLTEINKPGDQEMVKAFLESDLGIDQLFVQNLLDN